MKAKDFENASESTRRRNPELFGLVPVQNNQPSKQADPLGNQGQICQRPESRHPGRAEAGPPKKRKRKRGSIIVTLIAHTVRFMDGDNLQNALKAVRDAVADHVGIDDRDPVYLWKYEQMQGPGEKGVIVKIESR